MKRWSLVFLSLAGCATAPRMAESPPAAPLVETPAVSETPPPLRHQAEAENAASAIVPKQTIPPEKIASVKPPVARKRGRGPASIDDSLPVLMVCSGGANVPRVFSFSGESDKLRVFFGFKGGATVAGTAQISLRSMGDSPVFEGDVPVTGTRTPDGRRYQLSGQVGKQRFSMDLVYNGTGTLYRTIEDEPRERFEAHCQVEPRGGQ